MFSVNASSLVEPSCSTRFDAIDSNVSTMLQIILLVTLKYNGKYHYKKYTQMTGSQVHLMATLTNCSVQLQCL